MFWKACSSHPPFQLDFLPLRAAVSTRQSQICQYLRDWRSKWVREAPSTQPGPLTAGSPPLRIIKSMTTSWAFQVPPSRAQQACKAHREPEIGVRAGSLNPLVYAAISLYIRLTRIKPGTQSESCHWLTLGTILQLRTLAFSAAKLAHHMLFL